jgi:hypothetical protein
LPPHFLVARTPPLAARPGSPYPPWRGYTSAMNRKLLKISTLVFVLSVSGCDSDRLSQFGSFAAAGTAYVTTFKTFTDDAGSAFIATDSAALITARNIAGADVVSSHAPTYVKNVSDGDQQMRQYLDALKKLDNHAALLGAYFAAITQLTNGQASAATVASLDSLTDSINTFNPEIEQASFAGKNVKDFIQAGTTLVFAHFEVKALDAELKRSAPVIDRALALQEAAVAALSSQMHDSVAASLEVKESTEVINPYVSSAPLPNTWAANREAYLRQNVSLQSADCASAAIKDLHAAFTKLVTDRNSKIDFSSLETAIGKMAGYASAASASTSKPATP